MTRAFLDYFRCPEQFAKFALSGRLSDDSGFFRFGDRAICYGQSCGGPCETNFNGRLHDVWSEVQRGVGEVRLPFDPDQVIDNFRLERYANQMCEPQTKVCSHTILRNLYYLVRPFLPVVVRRVFQKARLRKPEATLFPRWPVDRTVDMTFETLMELSVKAHDVPAIPFIWFWPEGAPACVILTHDVETGKGRDFCPRVMDLDESYGFKASFQIVPEKRYSVPEALVRRMQERGFEVNIHDLNHDGNLFRTRSQFLRRVRKINAYAREFGARGFRSGTLYRNLDWYEAFNFSYDMSVPNVGYMEPQGGGCCTVLPYFVGRILEIPVTTAQDYSLFHILHEYSLDLWKRQVDLILGGNGLVSFIVHPDYIRRERPQKVYRNLLAYLAALRSEGRFWTALPGEVDEWWRQRSKMRLVQKDGDWQVQGEGHERARVAYAKLEGDRLIYGLGSPATEPSDRQVSIGG